MTDLYKYKCDCFHASAAFFMYIPCIFIHETASQHTEYGSIYKVYCLESKWLIIMNSLPSTLFNLPYFPQTLFLGRCVKGDWGGIIDSSVANCTVAVAEVKASR